MGSGPALMLVHGLSTCSELWVNQVEPLGRDYSVIAVDLRGFGQSDRPQAANSYSIDIFAADLAALAARLGIDPLNYLGTSMGGFIGQTLALDNPALISSLLLVHTAARIVIEDLADGYVSVERVRKDYGVVVLVVDDDLGEYEVDVDATERERAFIRANRKQWLQEDPEKVRAMVAEGAITLLDAIRRYGVILDRRTMELLPRTTNEFRKAYWAGVARYW
jgi:pimeloyl-ACP methyl ester carboxylesterase